MKLRFDPFEIDTDLAELRSSAGPIPIEPRVFDLLCLLAENTHRVLGKDELIATIWAGRFVSESAVAQAVKSLRQTLGDDRDSQRFVQTIRGRGYRFAAPVTLLRNDLPAALRSADPVTPAIDPQPTIAVLPFERAGLPEQFATLGDAIPADIISSLSRLRWLRVIARGSSFRFRGDTIDPAALRNALQAQYGLMGRVELDGTRLIVDVDLVDFRSGATLWSERYERPMADLHSVREAIVGAVISALDIRITLHGAAQARMKSAEHLDAWDCYHLGLVHMYRFNAHDNALASGLFERATRLDPSFATAYAAKSFTSFQNVVMGYSPDRPAAMAQARSEAERGVELDPVDPYTNAAMGRLHILTGALDDGLVWLDRSLELSPNYAKGHYSRAFLQVVRCETEATREGIDTAIGLSPLDPLMGPMLLMKAISLGIDGDFDHAAQLAVQAARRATTHLSAVMVASALCHRSGNLAAAAHWAKIARATRPDASSGLLVASLPFARDGFRVTLIEDLTAMGFPR